MQLETSSSSITIIVVKQSSSFCSSQDPTGSLYFSGQIFSLNSSAAAIYGSSPIKNQLNSVYLDFGPENLVRKIIWRFNIKPNP